ncbi:MAG: tetratricopeptide repeat protein [Pirellulales bacterium]
MFRALAFISLIAVQTVALAADFKVGDRVFWKDGTRGSDGSQEISIKKFAFPSTVLEIKNDFLFLGAGWINKNDALSTDEALEYFSERVKQHPKEPGYWINRGLVWEEKRDFDKAIADYQEAAKFAPDDATAHNSLGTAYQKKGDHKAAIAHFDAALKADPQSAIAYYNRGRANQYTGNYAAASKDYQEAARVDPNYLPAYNNAAWLAATCPEEKYRDPTLAVELAQKAVAMTQGKVWEALDTLAAAQAASGDYTAAVATSQQALELGSDAAVHGGVRDRMVLYQSGKPYNMPVDSPASP